MSRVGQILFWAGLGCAFWPYALVAAMVAWEHGNGGQYCQAWNPVTGLAAAPAAIAFLASAAARFDRGRALAMLVVILPGLGLALTCGAAHG